MTIFPDTPRLTRSDKARLAPVITNAKACYKWLATGPSIVDIKRAVLLEIESGRDITSRPIVNMLLVRLQKLERWEIWTRIAQMKGEWP